MRKRAVLRLLEQKSRRLIRAEQRYWAKRESMDEHLSTLGLSPPRQASRLYGFQDGCVLVRYAAVPRRPQVEFIAIDEPLTKFADFVAVTLASGKDLLVGKVFGGGGARLVHCKVGDELIPYSR